MPETPRATGNQLNIPQNVLRRKIWEGRVPLRLFLPSDVLLLLVGDGTPLESFVDESPALALLQGAQEPEVQQWKSLWLSPRRLSYLSLELSRILLIASSKKDPKQQELWVVDAHSGVPVKWQHPVGLLYDVCLSRNGQAQGQGVWELALVEKRPSVDALPLPLAVDSSSHDAILQPLYISSLKESDYSRHGSVKRVLSLPKEDQEALWTSVSQDDYETFTKVNASLVSEADSEDASRRSLIPLRVFIPSSTSGGSIQHLIQAKVKQMATVTSTETDEPAASAPAMLTIKETLEKLPGLVAVLPADTNRWEILCQGISIPLDAPLSLIARDLCMPDNFLNLVVASNREAQENVS